MNDLELIEKAKIEESKYNWKEAIEIYKEIVNNNVASINKAKNAGYYERLGYFYSLDADSSDNVQEYVNSNNLSINAYEKANELYTKLNDIPKKLECEAEILQTKGKIADSIINAKLAYEKSYNLFLRSSEIYNERVSIIDRVRVIGRSLTSLAYFASLCEDPKTIMESVYEGFELEYKLEELIKKYRLYHCYSNITFPLFIFIALIRFIIPFTDDLFWTEFFKKFENRFSDILNFISNLNDLKVSGLLFSYIGNFYMTQAFSFPESRVKQQELANKGLNLMEKGEEYLRKVHDKPNLIITLVFLNLNSMFHGNIEYVQKRILKDLKEVLELSNLFKGLFSIYAFYANLLPAQYYVNAGQSKFFTLRQRKKYSSKAIEFSELSLKCFPKGPFRSWSYQAIIWAYSNLLILSNNKENQNDYVEKMLKLTEISENLGKKYKGGYAKSSALSSVYRVYKTLADITQSKKEKEDFLKIAVKAQKDYIPHAIESRTGIISAQLRLGLLVEDLAKITEDTKIFNEAIELFQDVCIISREKGYISYSGAAHEYIARINDRLGEFSLASKNYEIAKKDYENSLSLISYKPLRKNLIEKIDYIYSWSIIEQAKAYHKREEHLPAKNCYIKAYENLKNLSLYNYEAPYYLAWSFLEESESLSKLEQHENAIQAYNLAISKFKDAIIMLDATLEVRERDLEKTKIEDLKKVANIRINYCSARIDLEEARILERVGKNLLAAEKFALAADQFNKFLKAFKTEREKLELKAASLLCKAWEYMELAENYQDPQKFSNASELFIQASELYNESKLKLLALGNSNICNALELGCKFDQTHDLDSKSQFYSQIKSMLKSANDSYRKGGFIKAADWSFAISSYFDAVWNLIKAEMQTNFNEKKKLLDIGSDLLNSTAQLFGKAGYENKEKEVLNHLDMIKKESTIILSALSTIKEPEISKSATGIIAPACPLEISLSSKLREARQISESIENSQKKKYHILYKDLVKEHTETQRTVFKIGITQIGLSSQGDIITELYEIKKEGLLGIRKDKVEEINSKIKNFVNKAHTNGISILIFPEMVIDLNYKEILYNLINLSEQYNMYIIPGSYHDESTKKNISVVISPNGILWQQQKHIPAIIHFEGKRFAESINTGTFPKDIMVCNTEYGRIAIAICRDFLDMDLRVELKNFEPPVDIVINPAFTPVTADFKAAHFDARRSIYAYCFFANVAEFGDSLIYTPEKEKIERTIASKKEGIIFKEIDLFKLRVERQKWEKEQLKERKFIQSTRI